MCCVVAVVAAIAPRIAILLVWGLTDWLGRAFDTWIWPVLGFLFMPYTTLAYAASIAYVGGVSGLWIIVMIVAVIADISSWTGGAHQRRTYIVRR